MSGIDAGGLKKACERIGEAAVDRATWPDVMADIGNSVGAVGAVLLQSDIRTPDVPRTASIDHGIQRYFKDGWHQRDLRALSTAVGRIALTSAMNALNAVCQPAIAIDRLGLVLDTNPAAEALFDEHIRVRNRRLVVADARARSCLEKLIDQIRVTSDMAALPCEPVVIPREQKGPVIARCLPIHGAQTPFLGAQALLSLTTVESKCGPKEALLANTFGLTPAEARVASIIAEGLNPERAAQQLGISKATARNQLKAVFAKTATHRQGELVALLSRL
jgi:DNA-binding CsgD family transcriptional regulator